MARGERTIRIKFDGSARGLARASADAKREVDGVKRSVETKTRVFARIGDRIGLDLSAGISGAFKGLPPQVQAAAAGAAALIGASMASAIGAALTAGVLLAVGGGVLAGGIAAAARDPKVAAAWAGFGERAKAALSGFAEPFKAPLIRAADTFAAAIERSAPALKEMGASAAPLIDKLAPGFAGLAEKSLPGIKKALEASKPLFDKIAEHLPKIGEALSKFFANISTGSEGAKTFLDLFFRAFEFWVPKLGSFLGFLSRQFLVLLDTVSLFVRAALASFGLFVEGAAKAFGWLPGIGPKLKAAHEEFKLFAKRVNAALDSIKDQDVVVNVKIKGLSKKGIRVAGLTGAGGFTEKAHGGPVSAGRGYLVGERGPEFFVPDRAGRIVPNNKLGKAAGGVYVENLNVRAYSDRFNLQQIADDLAWRGIG